MSSINADDGESVLRDIFRMNRVRYKHAHRKVDLEIVKQYWPADGTKTVLVGDTNAKVQEKVTTTALAEKTLCKAFIWSSSNVWPRF